MKIDVEGFEPFVLDGMQELLARSPDMAIVTEVSFAQWARVGDPAEILRRFAEGRKIFRIYYDGSIAELDRAELSAHLDPNFVSYILLLPHNSPREKALDRFLRDKASASLTTAPPRRSLLRRGIARLGRLMS
jgi:hypothetical protein